VTGVGVGVVEGVAQPFLRAPVQEACRGVGQWVGKLDVELCAQPAVAGARHEIGDRGVERNIVEVGWKDVDDQRSKRADAPADRLGRVLDDLRVVRRAVRTFAPSRGRERVSDAREILNRAVVQIARDLAPLHIARLQGAAQQELAFAEPQAQPSGK
jgi:hypothetical protein